MKALFTALILSVAAASAYADALIPLSFHGKASIEEVKAGKLTVSYRLTDRTVAPYGYKVGNVLAMVNTAKEEDARSFDDQVKVNAYGSVVLTSIEVKNFSAMSATEKAEALKFYTQEKIDEARGVFSILGFKFQK